MTLPTKYNLLAKKLREKLSEDEEAYQEINECQAILFPDADLQLHEMIQITLLIQDDPKYKEFHMNDDQFMKLETLVNKYDADTKSICTNYNSTVHSQIGGTCYANAIATVLRAAERRIIGRKIKSHKEIVDHLVSEWGDNGAYSVKVLDKECPARGLRYRTVNIKIAEEAMSQNKNRIILGSFYFNNSQWRNFSQFFRRHPTGIIKKSDIYSFRGGTHAGHAVAIIAQKANYWIAKNSWGKDFGDKGYFRIKKDAINLKLIDVYFVEKDLSELDKRNYQKFRMLVQGHK
eukprot:467727_1